MEFETTLNIFIWLCVFSVFAIAIAIAVSGYLAGQFASLQLGASMILAMGLVIVFWLKINAESNKGQGGNDKMDKLLNGLKDATKAFK